MVVVVVMAAMVAMVVTVDAAMWEAVHQQLQ